MTPLEVAAPVEPRPGTPPGAAAVRRGAPRVHGARGATRGAVRATARILAAPDGRGGTALPVLVGGGPFAPRRTRAAGPDDAELAQVTIVGAMSAPLGGDRLRIEVRVEAGARLRVTSAAATLALPGGVPDSVAEYDVEVSVGEGAELHWSPEPLIAAAGSRLRMRTRIDLAGSARLWYREEQVLGRYGERPGRLDTRLTVRRDGRPLLDQEQQSGPGAPGWDGPAVLHTHRAVGQLLVVDPAWAESGPPGPHVLGATAARRGASNRGARPTGHPGDAAVLPLVGPAALVCAAAPDALALRRLLEAGAARTRG
ncbi:urease accessory protein UreD [Allostreptomyces psammosilenae]|uniref:Urease accessory protein UreD n=1 Tax=Allostreptomyces psammosilenae TaxID=1892865 RepID=A0A852ZPT2_9ACTN|nr:urease accessory protein UreD [Allostreptomyces psammosilenae]NYI04456.1 urease accessory protein [Allostreptomyces psammosilenae]